MASLTRTLKAKIHAKIDESIGSLSQHRNRLHDAIRGGVLVDAVYILLDLHRETVKRETKVIIEASEQEDTIFILRNQLADAERDLAEAREDLAKHEKANEHNLALFRERGAQLCEARQELEEERAATSQYMAFHQDDTEHITSLAGQVKDLKVELSASKEQVRKLQAEVRFYQEVRQEEIKGLQQLHKEKAELNSQIGTLQVKVWGLTRLVDRNEQELVYWRQRSSDAETSLGAQQTMKAVLGDA